MEIFLKNAKQSLNKLLMLNNVHVIMGNETCDLDSAISALTYGYYIFKSYEDILESQQQTVLPVLNIQEKDYLMKTEVTYLLSKYNIKKEDLVFRDQVNLSQLEQSGKLKLYLVDHHVLKAEDIRLKNSVVGILDHRPQDEKWKWMNLETCVIDPVGSCCTLITKEIVKNKPEILYKEFGELLHGTIILDTVNFSKEAARAKPLDLEMVQELENLCIINADRQKLFDELLEARTDISKLSSVQLLYRDMKMLDNIALPGLPILVKDFVKRNDASEALKEFSMLTNSPVIIPMGLVVVNGNVIRDIAIYYLEECELASAIHHALISARHPDLKLHSLDTDIQNLILFSQVNINASRKQILPIIKDVLHK